ncbi:SRPBCC family protein [Variovorax sp. dw_308]|uniref:SRPBCC family protein n=1 Tax=Variovorax sp. dw_308 TaxID=2721546 RepID=UPI001C48482E|nr:SRPBCC family protein [Variovorax sp. dw_308]
MERSTSRAWKRWVGAALVVAVLVGALFVPMPAGVTRIVSVVDIARPPAEVYAYVTTPAKWPLWHPSSLAVSGDAGHSLNVGETVGEDFLVAGRRGRATWRVTAREPDRLWRIAGQINGRDAGIVSYSVAPIAGGGTHFVREFEYEAHSLLFAFLNAVTLRRQIEEESAQAVRQLKANLEREG